MGSKVIRPREGAAGIWCGGLAEAKQVRPYELPGREMAWQLFVSYLEFLSRTLDKLTISWWGHLCLKPALRRVELSTSSSWLRLSPIPTRQKHTVSKYLKRVVSLGCLEQPSLFAACGDQAARTTQEGHQQASESLLIVESRVVSRKLFLWLLVCPKTQDSYNLWFSMDKLSSQVTLIV